MSKRKHRAFPAIRASLLSLCIVLTSGTATIAQSSTDQKDTLRAVTLLFRHSVISPKYNPPKVKVEWPMGPRQLTAIGMRQMYEEGRELRRIYVDEIGLISSNYHQSEIYVRASNTDRALQSAQLLMLGLYPLGVGPDPSVYDKDLQAAPSPGLAFTPVPIHAVALENDLVLRPWTGKADCKRYKKFVKALPNTKLYREQGEKHQAFLTRIASVTGLNEGESPSKILYQVNEIYEPLTASLQHNLGMPEAISGEDLKQLRSLADWNYHHQFLGKQVGQLTGGPFVGEVLGNFFRVVQERADAKKLYLYSAHQRTILGMEAALGIETARTEGPLFTGRVPALASHYAFELHETAKDSFSVRLRYVSGGKEQVIPLPGCQTGMCPLKAFSEAVNDVIPRDWRRACKA